MKTFVALAAAALALAGCNRPGAASQDGAGGRGRYVGVGIYSPSELWRHLVRKDEPKDPAAATLRDDDEIIVVMDSTTGQIRQCGNLSGHCIAMDPWTRPVGAGQGAPVTLGKHAAQIEQDARAARGSNADLTLEVRPGPGPEPGTPASDAHGRADS